MGILLRTEAVARKVLGGNRRHNRWVGREQGQEREALSNVFHYVVDRPFCEAADSGVSGGE